jgi:DNA invertase Pin-like site-specific DNA recombinase
MNYHGLLEHLPLLLNLLEELKLWNVNLVSVKEGIDTSTPMGEMVATMLSAISKMELFNISHRVKSGIANARRKGDGSWGKKSNLTDEVKEQILQKRKKVGVSANSPKSSRFLIKHCVSFCQSLRRYNHLQMVASASHMKIKDA